jgi:hypothetical protein
MFKTMKDKRDDAMMRTIEYESRTTEQQLEEVRGRRGNSKKEIAKLEAKLEAERPSKKNVAKKGASKKKEVVDVKTKKKFKKGVKKERKS